MRKGLLLILSILLPSLLWAESISQETALQKASSFLEKRQPASTRSKKAELRLATASEDYFIFNVGQKEGFVIISGDDCAPDIIGYADEGQIDPQNMPDNMRSWLQGYADQISWMKAHGVKWQGSQSTTRALKPAISPLLTCNWDQTAPYNNNCPIFSDERTVTGCVATAMAQIMYYHKYPSGATALIPAYTTRTEQIAMSELPSTTFEWNNMVDNYNGSYSDAQAAAVAKLMLYCGSAVKMDYDISDNGGSGAYSNYVPDALINYFGYDAGTNELSRSDYSYLDWIDIIYDELANNRPVFISGQSTGGGHAFVCDGFAEDDFFHINWGWGGSSNGSFRISLLAPSEQGTGGSSTSDGYNLSQSIIVGIRPDAGTPKNSGLTVKNLKVYDNSSTSVVYNRSYVEGDFNPILTAEFWNYSIQNGTYDFGLRIKKGDTTIKDIIWTGENGTAVQSNHATIPASYIPFGANYENGTYKIVAISKLHSESEWTECIDADKYYIEAIIDGTSLTLNVVAPSASAADLEVTEVSYATGEYPTIYVEEEVTVKVKNNGAGAFHGDITFAITWKDSEQKQQTQGWGGRSVDIDPGETKEVKIKYTPTMSGSFTANVYQGRFSGTILYTNSLFRINDSGTSSVDLALSNLTYNNDGNNIYGNTLKVSFDVKNNGSESYNYGFAAKLYHKTTDTGGPLEKELTDNQALAAGASTTLHFEFPNLEYGEKYFCYVGYYDYSKDAPFQRSGGYSFTITHGFITYDADGKVTASAPTASVTVPADAAVVDLRGQTTITSITPNSNPNCIYLLDAGATVPSGISNNIVKGATAASISLTDGYAFYTPIDFTAEAITYKRTITIGNDGTGNGWTTINLPFDVSTISAADKGTIDFFHSKNDTGKSFWVHNFSSDEGSKVKFGYTDQIKANTPYLISVPGNTWGDSFDLRDKELTFSGSNAAIKASTKAVVSGNNYKFYGTYKQESLTNSYILNAAGNSFKHTSGTIEAFRGYFAPSAILTSLPTSLSIGFGDDGSTGIFNILNAPQKTSSAIYNLRGEKVGTTDDMPRLPKGIYIINGKKIIK